VPRRLQRGLHQQPRADDSTSSARWVGASSNLLDGLNPERIVIAMESIGMGQAASSRDDYANERIMFDVPRDVPAVAHPLPTLGPSSRPPVDGPQRRRSLRQRRPSVPRPTPQVSGCGAGFWACDAALQVHGGYGYAPSTTSSVSGEITIVRLAPISQRWCSIPKRTRSRTAEVLLNALGPDQFTRDCKRARRTDRPTIRIQLVPFDEKPVGTLAQG